MPCGCLMSGNTFMCEVTWCFAWPVGWRVGFVWWSFCLPLSLSVACGLVRAWLSWIRMLLSLPWLWGMIFSHPAVHTRTSLAGHVSALSSGVFVAAGAGRPVSLPLPPWQWCAGRRHCLPLWCLVVVALLLWRLSGRAGPCPCRHLEGDPSRGLLRLAALGGWWRGVWEK